MAFYTRRRRAPTIPLVSLIDILTILLIFFTVTTTFKTKDETAQLKITLPSAKALSGVVSPAQRIPLAVSADGQISLDGQPATLDNLAALLAARRAANAAAPIDLKADTTLQLGTMVKVWDALKSAGYDVNRDVTTKIQLKK